MTIAQNGEKSCLWQKNYSLGFWQMQNISTAHTRFVVSTNGSPISFNYKMVTLTAHWIPATT